MVYSMLTAQTSYWRCRLIIWCSSWCPWLSDVHFHSSDSHSLCNLVKFPQYLWSSLDYAALLRVSIQEVHCIPYVVLAICLTPFICVACKKSFWTNQIDIKCILPGIWFLSNFWNLIISIISRPGFVAIPNHGNW